MSGAMEGLRLVSGRGLGRRRWTARGWLAPALVAVALLAVLVASFAGRSSERRALRELPADERTALLARIVEDLRQSCGPGRPDALRDHCREQAAFALQFDECRGECDALARRELAAMPTR
jgi:hypothetical protein